TETLSPGSENPSRPRAALHDQIVRRLQVGVNLDDLQPSRKIEHANFKVRRREYLAELLGENFIGLLSEPGKVTANRGVELFVEAFGVLWLLGTFSDLLCYASQFLLGIGQTGDYERNSHPDRDAQRQDDPGELDARRYRFALELGAASLAFACCYRVALFTIWTSHKSDILAGREAWCFAGQTGLL